MLHAQTYTQLHVHLTWHPTVAVIVIITDDSYKAQIFFCKTKTRCTSTHHSRIAVSDYPKMPENNDKGGMWQNIQISLTRM